MTEKSKKRLHLIISIVIGTLTLVMGFCFIASCVSIYRSGDRPFTAESIATAFGRISPIVYLYVTAVLIGALLQIITSPRVAFKSKINTDMLLSLMQKRISVASLDSSRTKSITKERRLRMRIDIGGIILLIASLIYPLIYVFNTDNFTAASPNEEIMSACVIIAASLAIPLAYRIITLPFLKKSKEREIELLKSSKPESDAKNTEKHEENVTRVTAFVNSVKRFFEKNGARITLGTRLFFLISGALFIILGIVNGGMDDVLQKAVRICTECIGLG